MLLCSMHAACHYAKRQNPSYDYITVAHRKMIFDEYAFPINKTKCMHQILFSPARNMLISFVPVPVYQCMTGHYLYTQTLN